MTDPLSAEPNLGSSPLEGETPGLEHFSGLVSSDADRDVVDDHFCVAWSTGHATAQSRDGLEGVACLHDEQPAGHLSQGAAESM